MIKYFKINMTPSHSAIEYTPTLKKSSTGDNWQKLQTIGAMEGLRRLSNTKYVNYQSYSFKKTANGNYNISVNGKSTSCFINTNDALIGSQAAPTIYQWLIHRDYGHSNKEAWSIIKSIFTEITWG